MVKERHFDNLIPNNVDYTVNILHSLPESIPIKMIKYNLKHTISPKISACCVYFMITLVKKVIYIYIYINKIHLFHSKYISNLLT